MRTQNSLVVLLFVFCSSFILNAQVLIKTLDVETYDQAINIVFPSNSMAESYEDAYIIRIKPSNDPEFSIRIVSTGKEVRVTKSESLNGNLFSFFSNLSKKEDIDDPFQLAQRVKVKNETRVLSETRFKRLQKEFAQKLFSMTTARNPTGNINLDATKDTKSASVLVHGTTYEIEYISGRNEFLSFKVYDYPIGGERFHSSLISWIKNTCALFERAN